MLKEEFMQLVDIDRNVDGDRLKGAAIVSKMYGDDEMSETLALLAEQMDFVANPGAESAIERSRQKLDKLIEERNKREAHRYLKLVRDEDILSKSGGRVTELAYSRIESRFLDNGLFDPKIFGGTGEIPIYDEKKKKEQREYFGEGIGHIELPCRTVLPEHYGIVARLLGISAEDVMKVTKYASSIVVDPGSSNLKKGTLISEEKAYEARHKYDDVVIMIGADGLYELLKALGYGDHPERLAFKIVPVIPPVLRPMFYYEDIKNFIENELNDGYSKLIYRIANYEKRNIAHTPEVIRWNENRMIVDAVDELVGGIKKKLEEKKYKISSKQTNMVWGAAQLAYVCRKNVIAYDVVVPEKRGQIKSLDLYPKTVKVKGEDGTVTDIPFSEVVSHNENAFVDFKVDEVFRFDTAEDETEKEREEKDIEAMNKENELYDDIENLWDEAIEKREELLVTLNKQYNMYMLA